MTLPRQPAAVVFDMDGLIFDTEALYQEAFLAAATEAGLVANANVFLNMVGRPWTANRTFLLDHFGADFAVDAFGVAWSEEPRLCLALEDSHNGVRSAASAGMMTIMVPDLLPPTDEIRGLCVCVVNDLTVVKRLLTR